MKIVNPEKCQRLVAETQRAEFSGWDFSWLTGRLIEEDPPWDYPGLVRSKMAKVNSLLDLGTGGGELLASLAPLPPNTHATESYPPNQAIAKARLSPLGMTLHATEEKDVYAFADARFDLVINRHESYIAKELYRILKPGGLFITQQVSGLNNLELNQVLEKKISFPSTDCSLANYITAQYEAGFLIEWAEKAALQSVFKDVGAIVYYLKAIPWQVEDFSPESHAEGLIHLHNIIEQQGEFIATAHRFLIVAQKQKED